MHYYSFLLHDWQGLSWSSWFSLSDKLALRSAEQSECSGFYRVRACGEQKLVYLGQTGRTLRERVGALRANVYRQEPPWNDPHTGAPGLWAWRKEEGFEYEVSIAASRLCKPERQCMEDMLLYAYRLDTGESVLCNHGRFHPQWTRPTNKAKKRAMLRLEQGQKNPAGAASLSPALFQGVPDKTDWLGLSWSNVCVLRGKMESVPEERGVYKLIDRQDVVYLGQASNLQKRLQTHAVKYNGLGFFCSYTLMPDALPHHLLERETDLIGAFYMVHKRAPRYQYRKH